MPTFHQHIAAVKKLGQCSVVTADTCKDTYTCFSTEALIALAQAYNTQHSSQAIAHASMSKRAIWKALRTALFQRCGDDEVCWICELGAENIPNVRLRFKPMKPTDMTWNEFDQMWLTTDQIRDVMQQYAYIFRSKFEFLGVFPIDFQETFDSGECIGDSMCDFDVSRVLSDGKTSFGMVSNTDKYEKPGEHWVSLYCNMDPKAKNYGIYFYDSNGSFDRREIPIQIRKFMSTIKSQMERLEHTSFPIEHNTHQQQRKNGHCGMFAICFLVAMLCGEDFHRYCRSKQINDKLMKRLRRSFFV